MGGIREVLIEAIVVGGDRTKDGSISRIVIGIGMCVVCQIRHLDIYRTVAVALEVQVVEQCVVIAARGGGDQEVAAKALLSKGQYLLPIGRT